MLPKSGQCVVSVSAGGAKVKMLRRLGTRPIGATPASAAMASHQAPAAFTSTGVR
jgi:hypothetical protein